MRPATSKIHPRCFFSFRKPYRATLRSHFTQISPSPTEQQPLVFLLRLRHTRLFSILGRSYSCSHILHLSDFLWGHSFHCYPATVNRSPGELPHHWLGWQRGEVLTLSMQKGSKIIGERKEALPPPPLVPGWGWDQWKVGT